MHGMLMGGAYWRCMAQALGACSRDMLPALKATGCALLATRCALKTDWAGRFKQVWQQMQLCSQQTVPEEAMLSLPGRAKPSWREKPALRGETSSSLRVASATMRWRRSSVMLCRLLVSFSSCTCTQDAVFTQQYRPEGLAHLMLVGNSGTGYQPIAERHLCSVRVPAPKSSFCPGKSHVVLVYLQRSCARSK